MVESGLNDRGRRRVLVLDPHPLMRHAIEMLVNAEPDLCAILDEMPPTGVLEFATRSRVDLIITDLVFPALNGFTLIRELRDRFPMIAIVVHSGESFPACVRHCISLGADAFVHKGCQPATLMMAVRKAIVGEKYLSVELARAVGAELRGHDDELRLMFSHCEFEVLQSLSRGLSSREIATSMDKSIKTIETYQARLKRKLGVKSLSHLIRFAVLHFAGLESSSSRDLAQ